MQNDIIKVTSAAFLWGMLLLRNLVIIDAIIGINWGRHSQTKMVPSMVVDLLLQNNVKSVKLLDNDDDIIRVFSDTNIDVSLTLKNVSNTITNIYDAIKFVQTKIKAFPKVKFKYVVIATNPFYEYRFHHIDYNKIVDALDYVQSALDQLKYGYIKTTLSHSFNGVMKIDVSRPSDAEFTDDIREGVMPKILNFLNQTGAPFLVDFFPNNFVIIHNTTHDFAFLDNKSTYSVHDINGLVYRNSFEFVHDSFVWAVKKLGYENIKICGGRVTWPTDGFPNANVQNAERFWKGMLPMAVSNRGTPMRPGSPIDIFIHSLSDEKLNTANLPYRRHFGIYRSNGEPKYKIDLSGQGRDIYPTSAKGISRMPDRWCVFNGNNNPKKTTLEEQYNFACNQADCTSMAPFGSCSMLTHDERISYAFNAYFQSKFQDEKACEFARLGKVIEIDPSRDGCVFNVEVVRNSKPLRKSIW